MVSECGEDLKCVAKEIQPQFPVGAAVCIQASDYVATQQARITELEEKGRAFFDAVQRQQYANDPVLPWPTVAPYANAFNDLLEPEDE